MSKPDHDMIHLRAGLFHAEISPRGATLARFRRGERDLILGLHKNADYALNNFYAGAVVGPVANRISNGRLEIDGITFQMERNEAGATALHSGSDGLHTLIWNIDVRTPDSVSLSCHLPDGHGGLPANRVIRLTYALDNDGLSFTVSAQTDQKTPMNIAHHPYWALEPDQSKTALTIRAHTYLPNDRLGLPNVIQAPVAGSQFDFTRPRPIGPNSELDHNFCLREVKPQTPCHVATLRAQDGLQLDIATTEVGLQVYTGSGLPTLTDDDCAGPLIHPNAGIALEPQGWPDAPNNPGFPSIMLNADETYRQITRYTVSQT